MTMLCRVKSRKSQVTEKRLSSFLVVCRSASGVDRLLDELDSRHKTEDPHDQAVGVSWATDLANGSGTLSGQVIEDGMGFLKSRVDPVTVGLFQRFGGRVL